MKKIILGLIIVSVSSILSGQIYTPLGQIQGESGNNNIGIGEENPDRKLVIDGTYPDNLTIKRNGGTDANNTIKFKNSTNSIYIGATSDNDFGIGFHPNLTSDSRFTVSSNLGYIGIGITRPLQPLHVCAQDYRIQLRLERTGSTHAGYVDLGGMNGDFSVWAGGYDAGNKFIIKSNGRVGIGTEAPGHELDVKGTIRAQRVKVNMENGADFVFDDHYELMEILELEAFIKKNKHLPDIQTANEMKKDGVYIDELNIELLQKVEELTLYIIQLNKKLEELSEQNQNLQKLISTQ